MNINERNDFETMSTDRRHDFELTLIKNLGVDPAVVEANTIVMEKGLAGKAPLLIRWAGVKVLKEPHASQLIRWIYDGPEPDFFSDQSLQQETPARPAHVPETLWTWANGKAVLTRDLVAELRTLLAQFGHDEPIERSTDDD